MKTADRRLLVGRRIVDFDLRSFNDGRGGTTHNPRIVLDNGAVLTFVVSETEVAEYGIEPVYHRPR